VKVLVTGTAGFIGSHLAMRLLARGDEVVGVDNLSDYYDVTLKQARLARFADHPGYTHVDANRPGSDAIGVVSTHHAAAAEQGFVPCAEFRTYCH
jgi:UDP-glucuronate 4-epimerase